MENKLLVYRKYFKVENHLAPYKVKYYCDDDCAHGGCPGHVALFQYYRTSDIFSITWRLGEKGEYTTSFNLTEFSIIQDFMNRLQVV